MKQSRNDSRDRDPRRDEDCPCKSSKTYDECCRSFHTGSKQPSTAEQLMRARYSAYYFRRIGYLLETHHPDTIEPTLRTELEDTVRDMNWVFLKVNDTSKGQAEDKKGKVNFTVKYFMDEEIYEITEHARFRKVKGRWKYYDGKG